jgi:DNA-directed RNA polymerase subunit RPC12/RpoP
MATAYCMKCKRKVDMKDPRQVSLRNSRPAVEGVCPVCGTKVFRIGKM